jgi:predicted secreted hydrolase
VPVAGLDLVVTPLLRNQELDLAVRYWEGAVSVEGSAEGQSLAGAGYVELVGYGEASRGAGEAVRQ